MKNIELSLAQINHYFQKMTGAAMNFHLAKDRQVARKQLLASVCENNAIVLAQPLRVKIPLVFVPIGHIGAVIWEGALLHPLFKEWLIDLVPIGWEAWIGFLPIVVLFAFSLAIGYQLHQLSFVKHDIEPKRLRSKQLGRGATVIVLLLLYISFLYGMMSIANTAAIEFTEINKLIVWLGLIELILGYFAIMGLELIYLHLWLGVQKTIKRTNRLTLEQSAKVCVDNYLYFLQSLQYLNEEEAIIYQRLPPNEKVSSTMAYFYHKAKSDTRA